MEFEYGGVSVRFIDETQVHPYDLKGNEIEEPVCKICGCYMNQVIGRTHYTWACYCGYQCEPKEI